MKYKKGDPFCFKGHELAVVGVYSRKNGRAPQCMECRRTWSKSFYRKQNPEIKTYKLRDRCGRGHVYAEGTYRMVTNTIGTLHRLCLICQKETSATHNHMKCYGITIADRDALFLSQGQCCAICKGTDHKGINWATDHIHGTKIVRGILCNPCNLVLGQIKDSVEIALAMVEYLRRNQNGSYLNDHNIRHDGILQAP